jgi:hypothetical protein
MNNNHITGTISTNNNGATYPIEATTFNNNVINDITTSAISCYGCRIIKNIINNIINFFISNTNLENNEIKDLNGDGSNPGGNTPGGGDTPGGDTPVNPGGDTPSSGETPTADSTLDTFINKITGGASGSVKSTVLANKISAQDTPNTYSYLQ